MTGLLLSLRKHASEPEPLRPESFAGVRDLGEVGRYQISADDTEQDAVLLRFDALDSRRAEERCAQAIEGARRAAALHVTELRDP